jgi:hypothetical protein
MTGFEPATSGATVRRSTAELHPPYVRCESTKSEVRRLNHEGRRVTAEGRSRGIKVQGSNLTLQPRPPWNGQTHILALAEDGGQMGCGRWVGVLRASATQIVPQQDRFRDLALGAAPLAALALDGQIRFLLADAEVSLQDAFRSFHDLARLQALR